MGSRFYALLGELTLAIAVMVLSETPLYAQGLTPAAKTTKPSTPARTPNGHPDMEGYWTNQTFTPLERPVELGTKEYYTEAEAAAIEQQRIQRENNQKRQTYDRAWQVEKWASVSSRRTSMIFDPPDGRIPPLTEKGKQRVADEAAFAKRGNASESAQSRPIIERCLVWGNEGPPMLGSTYNANLQILQTPSSVVIRHEMIHATRVVRLDGSAHLGANIQQWGGDSRGHWDNDTLIIDTTNFTDYTNFRGPPGIARQDIFTDRNLHVVERFTLQDPNTIVYRFTVDDPTIWTRPWSGELEMKRTTGPIFEYACHEGNYGLINILSAARAAEKAAANKVSK